MAQWLLGPHDMLPCVLISIDYKPLVLQLLITLAEQKLDENLSSQYLAFAILNDNIKNPSNVWYDNKLILLNQESIVKDGLFVK